MSDPRLGIATALRREDANSALLTDLRNQLTELRRGLQDGGAGDPGAAAAGDAVGSKLDALQREFSRVVADGDRLRTELSRITDALKTAPAAAVAAPAAASPCPVPVAAPASAGDGIDDCRALWKQKVDEHMALRDSRRALAAGRSTMSQDELQRFFFDPWDPEWGCGSERKIGTPKANGNDGPKWTCGIHVFKQRPDKCMIFSFGSNNIIDFEVEMYKWTGCEIHVFDPSVDGSIAGELKRQANAEFHSIGLSDRSENNIEMGFGARGSTQDLGTILRTTGTTGRRIDVRGVPRHPGRLAAGGPDAGGAAHLHVAAAGHGAAAHPERPELRAARGAATVRAGGRCGHDALPQG
jgi:hypothetical protein